jgi:hypothetical protein
MSGMVSHGLLKGFAYCGQYKGVESFQLTSELLFVSVHCMKRMILKRDKCANINVVISDCDDRLYPGCKILIFCKPGPVVL